MVGCGVSRRVGTNPTGPVCEVSGSAPKDRLDIVVDDPDVDDVIDVTRPRRRHRKDRRRPWTCSTWSRTPVAGCWSTQATARTYPQGMDHPIEAVVRVRTSERGQEAL